MLTFFYSTQTCSTAVHIALEEAGIPFKGVEVSWKRMLNVEELAAVNPLGQVPVLVDEGKTLIQSIAILEYIGELAPAKNLLPPAGTWERNQVLAWLSFVGADLQKAFPPLFLATRWTSDTNTQAEIRKTTLETINKHLAYADSALAGKDFVMGKQFTVADAYLFTIMAWCKWAEVKTGQYSNLTAYMKRVYNRPAVQRVLVREEMLDCLPV